MLVSTHNDVVLSKHGGNLAEDLLDVLVVSDVALKRLNLGSVLLRDLRGDAVLGGRVVDDGDAEEAKREQGRGSASTERMKTQMGDGGQPEQVRNEKRGGEGHSLGSGFSVRLGDGESDTRSPTGDLQLTS